MNIRPESICPAIESYGTAATPASLDNMTCKYMSLLLFQKAIFKQLNLDISGYCGKFKKEIYHNLFITINGNLCANGTSCPTIL